MHVTSECFMINTDVVTAQWHVEENHHLYTVTVDQLQQTQIQEGVLKRALNLSVVVIPAASEH